MSGERDRKECRERNLRETCHNKVSSAKPRQRERKSHSDSTRCAQKRRILKDTVKDMRYHCRCPFNLLGNLFPGKNSNSMKHFLKLSRRRLESKPVAFKFSSLKSIIHPNIFRTQGFKACQKIKLKLLQNTFYFS